MQEDVIGHEPKVVKCPFCHANVIEEISSLEGDVRPPTPGDIAICFHCLRLVQFNQDLQLNPMSSENIADLEKDAPEMFEEIRSVLSMMQHERARWN